MNLLDAIQMSNIGPHVGRAMPEIILIITMCAVILAPFVRRDRVKLPTVLAVLGLFLALVATGWTLQGQSAMGEPIFQRMLVVDPFSQFFKVLLIVFTMFIIFQWMMASRYEIHPLDVPDYLCLLLGAAAGMALMASASNLVM